MISRFRFLEDVLYQRNVGQVTGCLPTPEGIIEKDIFIHRQVYADYLSQNSCVL